MKKILKASVIVPFAIISIFVFVYAQKCVQNNDIKENGVLVYATILEYLGATKGGSGSNPNYLCRFTYNGEIRTLISPSGIKSEGQSYVGKIFPALFSSKTNSLRLLITEDDYVEFGIEYPDSLKYK